MKIVLLIVAALAGLAALMQVPEFLQLFAPDTPQNLFTTIRQRVLLHDIGIAAVIALAAGFGAAVLHRLEQQGSTTAAKPPTARTGVPQRYCRHCAAPVGARETTCWKCGKQLAIGAPTDSPTSIRRRCPECSTMVPIDRPQCWNCGHRLAVEDSPLGRLMPIAPMPQPATAPATPADPACAGCGRQRDAEARFCAGCGYQFEVA
jgi:hypothetical protein